VKALPKKFTTMDKKIHEKVYLSKCPSPTASEVLASQHLPPKFPILLGDLQAFAWLESMAARQAALWHILGDAHMRMGNTILALEAYRQAAKTIQ
jgi:hypothetical protein